MPWLGTFHSIGVKMLRRHAELAGLRSDFTILDTDDVDPPDQAADPGRGAGRQALAGAPVRADDRRLEEQGPRPRRHPRGRRPRLRQRQGPRTLPGLSGPPADAERLRFRRPALPPDPHLPRQSRRAEGISPALQIHPRRRVPGHQHRAVHVAAAAGAAAGSERASPSRRRSAIGRRPQAADRASEPARGRPRGGPRAAQARSGPRAKPKSTSAASATTTSRSMAGAAPRSTTSCASTRIFPAPPSSGWSATTAPPPTSSAPPPISSPTMRAGSARRCSPTATDPEDGKVNVHAAWDSEEEARAVGEEIEQLPAPEATSSTTWRSWCAPRSRCATSRTASSRSASTTASSAARASTSARKSATRWPICASSRKAADDLAFERIVNVPKRGLGEAAIRQIHDTARALRHPDAGGRRQARRERRAEAEAARRAARGRRQFRALAEGARHHAAHRARRDHPRGERLHRHVEERPLGRGAGPARKPEGADPLDGGLRVACAPSSSMSRWSWTPSRTPSSTPSRS